MFDEPEWAFSGLWVAGFCKEKLGFIAEEDLPESEYLGSDFFEKNIPRLSPELFEKLVLDIGRNYFERNPWDPGLLEFLADFLLNLQHYWDDMYAERIVENLVNSKDLLLYGNIDKLVKFITRVGKMLHDSTLLKKLEKAAVASNRMQVILQLMGIVRLEENGWNLPGDSTETGETKIKMQKMTLED